MYRISVDESRRSLCLCDVRNVANCLYAIRESSDANPRCTTRAWISVAVYYSWKRDFLNEHRDSRL